MRVRVSCPTKFWSANLAGQLQQVEYLDRYYTIYFSSKNTILSRFVRRQDVENIDKKRIITFTVLAGLKVLNVSAFIVNSIFDLFVAIHLFIDRRFDVFIGWSGASSISVSCAKYLGKYTILERGSAHIGVQHKLLEKYFKNHGLGFKYDKRIETKELQEYKIVDTIMVPSTFVYDTFQSQNVTVNLEINHYGSSSCFRPESRRLNGAINNEKLKVAFVGGVSVRKGLLDIIEMFNVKPELRGCIEIHAFGDCETLVMESIRTNELNNVIFTHGHISQESLASQLSSMNLGILPSVEDGFGMAVVQMMSSGLPCVVSTNTGAKDCIKHGVNGYVLEYARPDLLANKLLHLHEDRILLARLCDNVFNERDSSNSWSSYGYRYVEKLKKLC